jgi:hypothetical protein
MSWLGLPISKEGVAKLRNLGRLPSKNQLSRFLKSVTFVASSLSRLGGPFASRVAESLPMLAILGLAIGFDLMTIFSLEDGQVGWRVLKDPEAEKQADPEAQKKPPRS